MAVTKLVLDALYTGVPGAYSRIDRTQMAGLNPSAVGVVCLIGEGEGGGAGGGTVIESFSTPQQARDFYRSGPLLENAMVAFDPSLDAAVPGGAREVRCVKVNPATKSFVILANGDGNCLRVDSQDYGLFTSQIKVQAYAGAGTSESFSEAFEDSENVYEDIDGDAWFTLAYALPATPAVPPLPAAQGYKTTASASIGKDASLNPDKVTVAATWANAGQATNMVFTAGDKAIAASHINNAGKNLTIYGIDADGKIASEVHVLDGAGAYTTTTRWKRLTGATLLPAVVTANLTITDTPGASPTNLTIPIGSTSVGIIPCENMPVANRPVSLAASGATTDPVVIRGLDVDGNAQTEWIALADAVAVTTQRSWSAITQIEIGAVNPARTTTLTAVPAASLKTSTSANGISAAMTGTYSAAAFTSGDRARVVSANALDVSIAVTVYGLDTLGAYQTETITTDAVDGSVAVDGTKTWSKVLAASIPAASLEHVGSITVSDQHANLAQTIVVKRIDNGVLATTTRGFWDVTMPVNNTTVSLVASGASVRQVLVEGYNISGVLTRELVTLTGAVAKATTGSWSRITRIFTGDVENAQTVTVTAAYPMVGGRTTIQQVVDYFNALDGFTAAAVTDAPTVDLVSELDVPAAQDIKDGPIGLFYALLTETIRYVNDRAQFVELTRLDGATGVPTAMAAPVFLSGGSEGVSSFANWQAAIDKCRGDYANTYCVLTDNPAVHSALDAHLVAKAGLLRKEADGKVGVPAGSTKTATKSLIRALNTRNLSTYAQEIQRYDSNGVATWFPPYTEAVLMAGMQAGSKVGTPMTHKYAKVLDVRQDASWNPVDDAEEMLDGGLCFLAEEPGIGFRWLRAITSWLQDSNLANIEQSVNHAGNIFIYNFRGWLEVMIGSETFEGTVATIRSLCISGLQSAVRNGWLRSYDADTLSVVEDGDTVPVTVSVIPAGIPINFIPITAIFRKVTA